MKNAFSQLKKQTKRAATLLLCLWLSGAFCALNCQMATAQTVSTVETAAAQQEENLPPCHRKHANAENAETNSEKDDFSIKGLKFAPLMACCTLLNQTFEPAKNFGFAQQLQTAKVDVQVTPRFLRREFSARQTYHPTPRSRDGTYLKNRVLLI